MLALNALHELETSPLDAVALTDLLAWSPFSYAVDGGAGFLIALDRDAPYTSVNFRWFDQRFSQFTYIDRVIVAAAHQGQGLAKRLYGALFADMEAHGDRMAVCEVNTIPPNPASAALHTALGFAAVGTAVIHNGAKTVRYLARSVGS